MANHLKMATVNAILTLWQRGWSFRRIARELGIHRDTVSRHVWLAEKASSQTEPEAKQATPPSGSDPPKPANPPTGSDLPKQATLFDRAQKALKGQALPGEHNRDDVPRCRFEPVTKPAIPAGSSSHSKHLYWDQR